MQNVPVPPTQMHDPQGKANPEHSRDPIRSPMQWNSGPNAGFSPPNVTPWLPLADDYQTYNVASEQNDPRSFLSLTRALLTVRRSIPALVLGSYRSLDQDNVACFAYLREHEEQRYLVVINSSAQEQVVPLPELGRGRIVLSTHMDREGTVDLASIQLRENEGCLIEVLTQ